MIKIIHFYSIISIVLFPSLRLYITKPKIFVKKLNHLWAYLQNRNRRDQRSALPVECFFDDGPVVASGALFLQQPTVKSLFQIEAVTLTPLLRFISHFPPSTFTLIHTFKVFIQNDKKK